MIKLVKVITGNLNITHGDQEISGLHFECRPSNGVIYVKIEALDEAKIDLWIERTEASVIDEGVYNANIKALEIEHLNNRKSICQSEISEIDARLLVL